MQLYAVAAAPFSRNPACCRAGLGKAFLQLCQQGFLFRGKAYAEGDGTLHGDFVSQTFKTHNTEGRFLPGMNAGGSAPNIG